MSSSGIDVDSNKGVFGLPRLTSRVFVDLAIWMASFGVVIGLVFPFSLVVLGAKDSFAFSPKLYIFTISAGIIVSAVNFMLARGVVGRKIGKLASSMHFVADALQIATQDGDRSLCSPEKCRLVEDSEDEIGDAARSFNLLLDTLARSQYVEFATSAVTKALAEHLVFEELAQTCLLNYIEFSNANAGVLFVVRDGKLEIGASKGLKVDLAQITQALQPAMESREIKSIDIPEDLYVDAIIASFRPREVIAVPNWLGGTPLGVIVLAYSTSVPTETKALLAGFQSATAVALNNALTHERFQLLAAVDPLTGAYNRRFGIARLNEEISRSIRTSTPIGFVSFDIDHFKKVNDTYGHLAGDQVLCEITKVARSTLRDGDVLVRMGGEEFLILLPGAGDVDVKSVAERIRRTVELTVVGVTEAEIRVTVSLGGLSYFGFEGRSSEDILNEVDLCMYDSKRSGRNLVTMAKPHNVIQKTNS